MKTTLRFAMILMIVLCAGPIGAGAQANDLFSIVNDDVVLSGEQSENLDRLRSDPATATVRLVRIAFELARTADELNFNVVPEEAASMSKIRIDERAPDDYSWFGGNPATAGDAALVVKGDDMVGTIRCAGRLYRIRPLGDGLHAVVEVDESALPPDHPPDT